MASMRASTASRREAPAGAALAGGASAGGASAGGAVAGGAAAGAGSAARSSASRARVIRRPRGEGKAPPCCYAISGRRASLPGADERDLHRDPRAEQAGPLEGERRGPPPLGVEVDGV